LDSVLINLHINQSKSRSGQTIHVNTMCNFSLLISSRFTGQLRKREPTRLKEMQMRQHRRQKT